MKASKLNKNSEKLRRKSRPNFLLLAPQLQPLQTANYADQLGEAECAAVVYLYQNPPPPPMPARHHASLPAQRNATERVKETKEASLEESVINTSQ
jgi:hypothetical protein